MGRLGFRVERPAVGVAATVVVWTRATTATFGRGFEPDATAFLGGISY